MFFLKAPGESMFQASILASLADGSITPAFRCSSPCVHTRVHISPFNKGTSYVGSGAHPSLV